MGCCEFFRPGAYEVHVRTLFENNPRGFDWIAKALDAGHTTGFHPHAIHEQRIKLDAAIGCEKAAVARVEGGIVFKRCDSGFDRIKGRSTPREDGITGGESVADAGFVGGLVSIRNSPGAAMHEQDRRMLGAGCHLPMVVHFEAGYDGFENEPILKRSRQTVKSNSRLEACARLKVKAACD